MQDLVKINSALISVSDKTGLISLAENLQKNKINIIATGSTASYLQENGIATTKISDITSFPEIMNGRVKTLHPKIHGGILGRRDKHNDEAKLHNIPWIDLVICNFYPFSKVAKSETISDGNFSEKIENIDIGGPTMVRAAAKNFEFVTVLTNSNDYEKFISEYNSNNGISFEFRKKLAARAFSKTAKYESDICNYFNDSEFPEVLSNTYSLQSSLRYGENPHQKASCYIKNAKNDNEVNLFKTKQLHGKEMSYNNFVDVDAAINALKEYNFPTAVIVKHATPCGVSSHSTIDEAFVNAYMADSKSAFGGIVALNQTCTASIANSLSKYFVEIIIAPFYEAKALQILQTKKNLRILQEPLLSFTNETHNQVKQYSELNYKKINGGLLVQNIDSSKVESSNLEVVTQHKPSKDNLSDLIFAWNVAKHVKSNAIVIAKGNVTLGIGAGHVSRVDAVNFALLKAKEYGYNLDGAVIASDGFFPFADNIDLIQNCGIKHVIQPGGSIRDEEVVQACNKYGISMCFTKVRCFNH